MFRSWRWVGFAIIIMASGGGCSLANGRTQQVQVSSNVPAKLFLKNAYLGSTPTSGGIVIEVPRAESNPVIVGRADGYEETSVLLTREISALGILDLLGGIIIALPAVTFISGHAYEVAPEVLFIELEPQRAPTAPSS